MLDALRFVVVVVVAAVALALAVVAVDGCSSGTSC